MPDQETTIPQLVSPSSRAPGLPKLDTVEDYQRFLAGEAKDGSLVPGSPEEQAILEGFRKHRAKGQIAMSGVEAEPGGEATPGAIADELRAVESASGVVAPEASREAHEQVKDGMTIYKTEGQDDLFAVPVSASESSPQGEPAAIAAAAPVAEGPIQPEGLINPDALKLNSPPPPPGETMH